MKIGANARKGAVKGAGGGDDFTVLSRRMSRPIRGATGASASAESNVACHRATAPITARPAQVPREGHFGARIHSSPNRPRTVSAVTKVRPPIFTTAIVPSRTRRWIVGFESPEICSTSAIE